MIQPGEKEIIICPIASPCKDCARRTLGCHSACKEYAEFVSKCEELRQKRKETVEEQSAMYEIGKKVRLKWRQDHRRK